MFYTRQGIKSYANLRTRIQARLCAALPNSFQATYLQLPIVQKNRNTRGQMRSTSHLQANGRRK
jgi:hypothetical protein